MNSAERSRIDNTYMGNMRVVGCNPVIFIVHNVRIVHLEREGSERKEDGEGASGRCATTLLRQPRHSPLGSRDQTFKLSYERIISNQPSTCQKPKTQKWAQQHRHAKEWQKARVPLHSRHSLQNSPPDRTDPKYCTANNDTHYAGIGLPIPRRKEYDCSYLTHPMGETCVLHLQ
jgi:hypothetical protein